MKLSNLSLFWLLVFIIRIWLKLIWRIPWIWLVIFTDILALNLYIITTHWIEGCLCRFITIPNIKRIIHSQPSHSHPTWPVYVLYRHQSIATGSAFILTNIIIKLHATNLFSKPRCLNSFGFCRRFILIYLFETLLFWVSLCQFIYQLIFLIFWQLGICPICTSAQLLLNKKITSKI